MSNYRKRRSVVENQRTVREDVEKRDLDRRNLRSVAEGIRRIDAESAHLFVLMTLWVLRHHLVIFELVVAGFTAHYGPPLDIGIQNKDCHRTGLGKALYR